jgi:hypothetical protein
VKSRATIKREIDALRSARHAKATMPRGLVSIYREGEPEPSWPDKRPDDVWIVIGLPKVDR